MDDETRRIMALNHVSMRIPQNASTEELMAEADKLVAWMKGGAASDTAIGAGETSTEAPRHESEDAVAGQEPKGE